MTTRIELRHISIEGGARKATVEKAVEIGDEAGIYNTQEGKVEMRHDEIKKMTTIDLYSEAFSGRKGREKRTVAFRGYRGSQAIGNDREIFVERNVESQIR